MRLKIKKVHVYPNVTWKTLTTDLKYDAAILELGEEVKLSAKVWSNALQAACSFSFSRCFQYVSQAPAHPETMQVGTR